MQHSDLDFVLHVLSKGDAIDYLPQLMMIDAGTPGEPWGQEQWLMDLPGKWELSWLLLYEERPVGFLIASRKGDALHFHRLAVAADERCRGWANLLIAAAAQRALEQGCPVITLKVHHTNAGVIAFYVRLGFAVLGRQRESLEMMGSISAALIQKLKVIAAATRKFGGNEERSPTD